MKNPDFFYEEKSYDVNNMSNLVTINSLLKLLAFYGGKIVNINSLDIEEINQARASNRIYVDENLLSSVWIPNIESFPQTEEQIDFFEKWYPLEVEIPKEVSERMLKNIFREIKRKK